MAGWILVALWTSANSIAVPPTTFKHVRSAESAVRDLIADGYARSATMKAVVDRVEALPCVVYVVSTVKLSQGMRGALLHWPTANQRIPVLRVLLKTNLAHDEAIAVIGHELQHVTEAVDAEPIAGTLEMTEAFEELEPGSRGQHAHTFDTQAAIVVTLRIRDELQKRGLRARR
jgi:hypothetical protein